MIYVEEDICMCGGNIETEVWEEPITAIEWVRTEESVCQNCGNQNITERIGKCYGYR